MRYDLEAERAVLSSMLYRAEAIDDAISIVTADDFLSHPHAIMFQAICNLHEQGKAVDAVMLRDTLEVDGRIQDVGGQEAILSISALVGIPRNVEHYANIVYRDAVYRRLKRAGLEISTLNGQDEAAAVSQAVALAEAALGPERTVSRSVAALLPEVLESYAKPSESIAMPMWGLYVDKGDFVVVGARPSVGKTAWAVSEARQMAMRHLRVRFYSYEMSSSQILARLIAQETAVDSSRLRRGLVDDGGMEYVKSRMQSKWTSFLTIDEGMPTISRLVNDMRRFARKGGRVVVIDYLQLIAKQDYEQATEVSRQLKLAALKTGLVVIALSQLSRDGKQADGSFRKPSLADLRQTGAIEQDADVVVLLHDYRPDDPKVKAELEKKRLIYDTSGDDRLSHVEVAKARNGQGALGITYAGFDGKEQKWTPLEELA